MHILIVDDDEIRAASLSKYLVANGCATDDEVVHVTCLDDSKRALRNIHFDAMLLDVVIPKRRPESPSREHSINLLEQLSRGANGLRKPQKIIGITSHTSDLGNFQQLFLDYCWTVVEAPANSDEWKPRICKALNYTAGAELGRIIDANPTHVLTVHGIRTFGAWQSKLKRVVREHVGGVEFHTYRYGYFSAFALLLPFFRTREVDRFYRHLCQFLEVHPDKELVIFCHSFGTFIVSNALKRMLQTERLVPVRTIVLAGSVLPSRFDWSFALASKRLRIVNECGIKDYVLCLCDALVPLLGMAGRTGFHGINNQNFVNRFFIGGHDLYFKDTSFFQRYWLPLINPTQPIPDVDERNPNELVNGFFEKAISILSKSKEVLYVIVIVCVLLHFIF